MAEQLYLFMIRASGETPDGGGFWAVAQVEGIGRKLTRWQAEALGAQVKHDLRFLLPYSEGSEKFATGEHTLGILPGETIWHYGRPLGVDLVDLARDQLDGALSPDPDAVLVPVTQLVAATVEKYGDYDRGDIEATLDAMVMDLGGTVEGEPSAYRLPFARVLGIEGS